MSEHNCVALRAESTSPCGTAMTQPVDDELSTTTDPPSSPSSPSLEVSPRYTQKRESHTRVSEHDYHTILDEDQNVDQSIQLIPASSRDATVSTPGSSVTQDKTSVSRPPSSSPTWTRGRATIILIIVFFVIAVLLAVAHAIFYVHLNGTLAENRILEQSEVIAISLLITTLFKTCLIASIGLSFTQHLWKIFRQKLLRVSQIEQLFHIRSNPIELAKVKIVTKTPLLFFMAVFVWLLPLAVIYPPSSLTVTSRPYSEIKMIELSAMNVPPPENLDVLYPNYTSVPSLAYLYRAYMAQAGLNISVDYGEVAYEYVQPSRPLLNLARLVLLNGEILEFPSPVSENMSYSLEYQVLQVSCKEETQNWIFSDLQSKFPSVFAMEWYYISEIQSDKVRPLPIFNISTIRYPGTYDLNFTSRVWTYAVNTQSIICEPFSALLSVNVSYTRGVRHIEHSIEDVQSMPNITESVYRFPHGREKPTPNISEVPVDTPEYAEWVSTIKDRLMSWNIYTTMDASFRSLAHTWEGTMGIPAESDKTEWNGTLVPFSNDTIDPGDTIIEWSAFNTQRNNVTSVYNTERQNPWDLGFDYGVAFEETFDPRRDLNLNESMLNEFLINVSISALTLDTWRVQTPVNVTEYRTTYHFSRPINLIVPYSLSLGFALIFVSIGVWSLLANGVPATDGGFLQIVTTNTGRTEMEKLIENKNEDEDEEAVITELLSMRVRYGELVNEGGVGIGRAGFGTLAETRPLGTRTNKGVD